MLCRGSGIIIISGLLRYTALEVHGIATLVSGIPLAREATTFYFILYPFRADDDLDSWEGHK